VKTDCEHWCPELKQETNGRKDIYVQFRSMAPKSLTSEP
jgi:hypothetical protein